MLLLALLWILTTFLPSAPATQVGTVYSCTPVFIRTAPSFDAPVVVLDTTYAVVLPTEPVVYTTVTPHWVHLASGLGFIPAAALNDETCFYDSLPQATVCLQEYAQRVPSAHPDAALLVAAYLYYSAHYRVDPIFVLAQAFHESNVFRSVWAMQHYNYAGLWVSGAVRSTPPSSGYWTPFQTTTGTVWVAGRSFTSPIEGVSVHVERVAAYPSEHAVLTHWATDPAYARKIRAWEHRLRTACPYEY